MNKSKILNICIYDTVKDGDFSFINDMKLKLTKEKGFNIVDIFYDRYEDIMNSMSKKDYYIKYQHGLHKALDGIGIKYSTFTSVNNTSEAKYICPRLQSYRNNKYDIIYTRTPLTLTNEDEYYKIGHLVESLNKNIYFVKSGMNIIDDFYETCMCQMFKSNTSCKNNNYMFHNVEYELKYQKEKYSKLLDMYLDNNSSKKDKMLMEDMNKISIYLKELESIKA